MSMPTDKKLKKMVEHWSSGLVANPHISCIIVK